jgi:c-di-GMP-binding flagellar brake protein YcgR
MQRRRFRRIETVLDIEYSVEGKASSKQGHLQTCTKNIGAKGFCFSVKEDLALNSALSLKIHLGDKEKAINAKARVVWKGKFTSLDKSVRYDVGVDITQISEPDQKRLRQHIFELIDSKKIT